MATSLIADFEENNDVTLPKHKIVCPQCHGKGTSCAYLGSYTRDELDEQGPEFLEDYMSGVYDRTCDVCDGQNVIDEVDEDQMNPELLASWHRWCEEIFNLNAMEAQERAFGC